MSSAKNIPESPAAAPAVEKRVVLSMGGKGGVGKTSLMTGLAEWVPGEQHSGQAARPRHRK